MLGVILETIVLAVLNAFLAGIGFAAGVRLVGGLHVHQC